MPAPPEGFAHVIEWLKNPKNVGTAVVLFGAFVGGAVKAIFGNSATKALLREEHKQKVTPSPPAQSTRIAELELQVETLKVQKERAEWRASEWEIQYARQGQELDRVSAELHAAREKLQRFELEEEQRRERQEAAQTTEVVTGTWKIPPLPQKPRKR